jgi:hypothetical protein
MGLVLWAWFLLLPLAVSGQATFKFTGRQQKLKLPFQLHRNLVIVEVKLNGKGPYNFLLDTGVNTAILLQAGLRDSLHFSQGLAVEIAGAGPGSDLKAYFTPDIKVEMPGVVSDKLQVVVLSEDILKLGNYIGTPVAGILGYDFFNSFAVEVDFKNRKLLLHDPATFKPKQKWEKLPLLLEGNKPYLQTEIRTAAATIPVKLIIDTGAGHALSLETGSDARLKLPEKKLRAQLGVGLAGSINGYVGRVPELKLGKYKIQQVLASFPDSAEVQAKNTVFRNGNLGLELLRRFKVVFDYPHQRLYLTKQEPLNRPFEYDMCGLDLIAVPPAYRTYKVNGVHENSPAAQAGLEVNDELVAIDLLPATAWTLTELNQVFHSRHGREIQLLCKRNGALMNFTVKLQRRI